MTTKKPEATGTPPVENESTATEVTSPAPVAETPEQPAVEDLKLADQASEPTGLDTAELDDAPVRTTRPDVPILQSLATGAGAHEPTDPDVYEPDGRHKVPEDGWDTQKVDN